MVPVDGAVELQDPLASGRLMQAVDILGDDGGEPARLFQPGQGEMRRIGPGGKRQHLLPVKGKKLLRVLPEKGVAQDGLRRPAPGLAVKAVLAAEIGNARFRAHPRAAEKDDAAGAVDILLQTLLLGHGSHLPKTAYFFLPGWGRTCSTGTLMRSAWGTLQISACRWSPPYSPSSVQGMGVSQVMRSFVVLKE